MAISFPEDKLPNGQLNTDFTSLKIRDPQFEQLLDSGDGVNVNPQDAEALMQLTRSIIRVNFGYVLDLPSDRLCPPVPIRYAYIKWLQGLLDSTGGDYLDGYDRQRHVTGIDIGVGASCIYPLIGCACRSKWQFHGTELDEKNLEYARRNVGANDLSERISLHQAVVDGDLIPWAEFAVEHADFTMCNPPFFASRDEMLATYETKEKPPSAICTGAAIEMWTPGGEVAFVLRILRESEKLRDRVQWFTSMLGKHESVAAVVTAIKERGITNWALHTLRPGRKTVRWVVGWSYMKRRPRMSLARDLATAGSLSPLPATFIVPLSADESAEGFSESMMERCHRIDLNWSWDEAAQSGLLAAAGNTWSRAARRQMQKNRANSSSSRLTGNTTSSLPDAALVVRLRFNRADRTLHVDWLQGDDHVLFESLCGLLRREYEAVKLRV